MSPHPVSFFGKIAATLGAIGVLAMASLGREIVPEKELIITDPKVVDSPMATYPGTLSFGFLISELAGEENTDSFIVDWLTQWEQNQSVNGYTIPARSGMRTKVLVVRQD